LQSLRTHKRITRLSHMSDVLFWK